MHGGIAWTIGHGLFEPAQGGGVSTTRIERRLAAILALDVAGYSQLMGADEIGTLNALKTHRRDRIDPAIARHNGRIVTIAGDGLMVEFASVFDAVASAVTIQRAMLTYNAVIAAERQIVLRIGINVGDIIIDGGDIFGDGVNVAARLEALCEPGGICISRSANEQVRDRLALSFADRGEQTVKNIARAVGVFGLTAQDIAALPEHLLPHPVPPGQERKPTLRRTSGTLRVAGVAALTVAALGIGLWLGMPFIRSAGTVATPATPTRPLPPIPQDRRGSIAVLPFEANPGTTSRLSRDIAERLAADRGWPVVPAGVVARYQGKPIEPRSVGREQNVHFTLSGTVRDQDGHLRVTAALHETQEGRDLWSQSFDRPLGDEAVIVAMIAAEVNQAMIDAEVARARRDRPAGMDATDYYLAAIETAVTPLTRANLAARVALLDQALALDPGHLSAQSLGARLRGLLALNDWSADRGADVALGLKMVDRLLETRPRDIYQLRTRAYLLRAQGLFDQALAANRRVLELNPDLADPHREIGVIHLHLGQYEPALASFQAARRLADADFLLDTQTAAALLANARFADAAAMARAAMAEAPGGGLETPWLTLIAAEAGRNQLEDARAQLQRYLAGTPSIRSLAELRKDKALADLPNLTDGLRRAGLPEE